MPKPAPFRYFKTSSEIIQLAVMLYVRLSNVRAFAKLRRRHSELHGTVFHSTRKWFITQCERTGAPEHYTATLVGHHSARSVNKLTYALYSGGIGDAQKQEIVDGIRLPDWEGL